MKPYQNESQFWHGLWSSANKPSAGPLYQAMRQSKNQYKYAIRRLRNAGEKVQNDKFVESLLSNKLSIFKEIKKFRGNSKGISSRIDDEVGSSNIANHFANIYEDIYNKVELSDDFEDMVDKVKEEAVQENIAQINQIDDELIRKALKIMKSNKNDAIFNIQSDCFINGPPLLIAHLGSLVKSFLGLFSSSLYTYPLSQGQSRRYHLI